MPLLHNYDSVRNARLLLVAAMCMTFFAGAKGQDSSSLSNTDLLPVVASMCRANKERIQTWEGAGNMTMKIRFYVDKILWDMTYEFTVEFAYDKQASKYTYRMTQLREYGTKGTQKVDSASPIRRGAFRDETSFCRLPEWHMKYTPGRPKRPVYLICDPNEEEKSEASIDFNPMACFDLQSMDSYKRLMFLHNSKKSIQAKIDVSRDVDTVKVTIHGTEFFVRYLFALDKAGNPEEVLSTTSTSVDEYARAFIERDGVWVPDRFTVKNSPHRDHVLTMEVVLSSQSVNKPIDPYCFTPEWLGLGKGDTIRDLRSHIEYLYQGAPEPPGGLLRSSYHWVIVALLALITGLVAVILVVIKRRAVNAGVKPC